jgi:cholesterol transport system auxiliary component
VTYRRIYLIGLGLALALQGCSGFPFGSTPQLDTFELTRAAPTAEAPRRSRTQVLIAEPTALQALDGQNIVIKTTPAAIEYLSGAQWSDRLPKIVQARLAEAFQATGQLGGVGRPGEGLAIDYQIVTDVRAFEVRVDGTPRASVELFVRVLNDRNGTVRASRSFSTELPLGGAAGNDAYVRALDAAFAQLVSEIVPWAIRAM